MKLLVNFTAKKPGNFLNKDMNRENLPKILGRNSCHIGNRFVGLYKTGLWTYAETGLWAYAETRSWAYAETGLWAYAETS